MSGSTDLKPATVDTTTGKEAEHERADHLGNDAEAEPDDEQRRDRDLGHALREHEQRIDEALDRARIGDQQRDRDAEGDRQREPAERRVGRDQALAPRAAATRRRVASTTASGAGIRYGGIRKTSNRRRPTARTARR